MFKKRLCLCRLMGSEQENCGNSFWGSITSFSTRTPQGLPGGTCGWETRSPWGWAEPCPLLLGLVLELDLPLAGLTQGGTCREHRGAPAAHLVLSQGSPAGTLLPACSHTGN